MIKIVYPLLTTLIVFLSCSKSINDQPQNQFSSENNSRKVPGGSVTLQLGQFYEGGYIFYLDGTGTHGLIAAERDQGLAKWWVGDMKLTNAKSYTDGKANTKRIIQVMGPLPKYSESYAAKLCSDWRGGNFKDWYLPARDELSLLYERKQYVPNLNNTLDHPTYSNYWTSTEYGWSGDFNKSLVFYIVMSDGSGTSGIGIATYSDLYKYVRAIRKF